MLPLSLPIVLLGNLLLGIHVAHILTFSGLHWNVPLSESFPLPSYRITPSHSLAFYLFAVRFLRLEFKVREQTLCLLYLSIPSSWSSPWAHDYAPCRWMCIKPAKTYKEMTLHKEESAGRTNRRSKTPTILENNKNLIDYKLSMFKKVRAKKDIKSSM